MAGAAAPAAAKVFYSQEEALELAFPDADRVEKRTELLGDADAAQVEAKAQAPLPSRLVKLYTAWKDGRVEGYALIDVHTVRTHPEALLVVLTPDGRVRSLRVLAFYEPEEYLTSQRWLDRFDGRPLDDGLRLGGELHGIAGSTLSSRAVTDAVRRSLALYQLLAAPGAATAATAPHSAPEP
ncbi:MAG TPA: FMN-binding protein [Myxococcota bacterium]|nr:FMN-binding protein [Myxococcota bacterium]